MTSFNVHFTAFGEETSHVRVNAASSHEAFKVAQSVLFGAYPLGYQIERVALADPPPAPSSPTTVRRVGKYGPAVEYSACSLDYDGTCKMHGGQMVNTSSCQTVEVLADVRAERSRQYGRYGTNEDIEDGTGPTIHWLAGMGADLHRQTASGLEKSIRRAYEGHEAQHGAPTWRHLVLEEIAEAFQESDPARLRDELIQVAALAVSWVEKIDARKEG